MDGFNRMWDTLNSAARSFEERNNVDLADDGTGHNARTFTQQDFDYDIGVPEGVREVPLG